MSLYYPSPMEPLACVQAALATLGLEHEIRTFGAPTATAPEAAAAIGCQLGQVVKTLVFIADGRPTIALVAGDRHVDLSRLAALVGVSRKRFAMATPAQVREITGYDVGSVSPVGLGNPCDIVVDDSLHRFATAWAAAGTHDALFGVDIEALARALNGQWATITRAPDGD